MPCCRPSLTGFFFFNPYAGFKQTDHPNSTAWIVEFKDQSTKNIGVENQYIFLFYDFDPTTFRRGYLAGISTNGHHRWQIALLVNIGSIEQPTEKFGHEHTFAMAFCPLIRSVFCV